MDIGQYHNLPKLPQHALYVPAQPAGLAACLLVPRINRAVPGPLAGEVHRPLLHCLLVEDLAVHAGVGPVVKSHSTPLGRTAHAAQDIAGTVELKLVDRGAELVETGELDQPRLKLLVRLTPFPQGSGLNRKRRNKLGLVQAHC